jgi:hypothetical protein
MAVEKIEYSSPHRFRSVYLLLLPLLWGGIFPQKLCAQADEAPEEIADGQWMKYRVDASFAASQFKNQTYGILRSQNFAPGQQQYLQDYYKKYALPRWTERSNWKSLSNYRSTLRREFQMAKSGQVHKFLTQLVFDYMKRVAENPRLNRPARCNAMLALGELNTTDLGGSTPPTPLPEALPVLISTVESPDAFDGLKVEALAELGRHVALGLPEADQPKIKDLLLKLLTAESNADPKPPCAEWMRLMATEMLGQLGILGTNDEVVKALTTVLDDSKVRFRIRAAAARSLGQLNYPAGGAPGLNAVSLGSKVVQMVVDAFEAELKKRRQDDDVFKRLLKTRLDAAADGISGTNNPNRPGIKSLAGDAETKARFEELEKSFKAMQRELDDKELTGRKLEDKVREYQQKLKAWMAK